MRLMFFCLFTLLLGASSAQAQGTLGGYGGSMSSFDSGMGSSGPIIPYAGHYGGFMPSRMRLPILRPETYDDLGECIAGVRHESILTIRRSTA